MDNEKELINVTSNNGAAFVIVSKNDLRNYSIELIRRARELERNLQNESKDVQVLTKDEVKQILHVKSDATLWRWQQRKKLVPVLSDGGRVLYKSSDIKKLIK